MKKLLAVILIVCLVLSGCGKQANTEQTSKIENNTNLVGDDTNTAVDNTSTAEDNATTIGSSADKIKIVATTFPEYDWVKQIINGNEEMFELTLLMDSGVDLHNYNPTADDILKIASSDLFIFIGGESDEWVEDLLNSNKYNINYINLMDRLKENLKVEEELEGMQVEHEDDAEEHEEEYDEHIWLSLRNAKNACNVIAEEITKLDNNELYAINCEKYVESLKCLDAKFVDMINESPNKVLIFGDRYPFRYFTDDYSLQCYAAFSGCAAEAEASFETVAFLAKKMDELNIKYIIKIENSSLDIAQAVINSTKAKDAGILTLNSMQSVTETSIANGISYISIMEGNYDVIEKALQ